MKLIGCRYEGRESYAWEAFIDGFHDLGYTLTGIDRLDSVRSKYFPDSIRVEVSGIEWTERMLYEVRSLGIYMGGGNVSVAGEGSMWFDDLSIEACVPARPHRTRRVPRTPSRPRPLPFPVNTRRRRRSRRGWAGMEPQSRAVATLPSRNSSSRAPTAI